VRRAPRENGISPERIYQEYALQFPNGGPKQVQPASGIKPAPRAHPTRALEDGNGFHGTYYKGLKLTTNLQAVDRVPGESGTPWKQLALVLVDDRSKPKKNQTGFPSAKKSQDNAGKAPKKNTNPIPVPSTKTDPVSPGPASYTRKLSPEMVNRAWPTGPPPEVVRPMEKTKRGKLPTPQLQFLSEVLFQNV